MHRHRVEITRRLEFDAGHRVLGHEGKCANLHGHRYVAEITITAPRLDDLGRVIDFGQVKSIIGGWIDEHWDHNMILHPHDPLVEAVVDETGADRELDLVSIWEDTKRPYIMPIDFSNPTAENMAVELYSVARRLLKGMTVTCVRLSETPNCWAHFTPEP